MAYGHLVRKSCVADPPIQGLKIGESKIAISGPVINEKCRAPFIEKLVENGRDEILTYENS